MGFNIDVSIPVFTVLLQGLLSFFSPCVLPLIPLYMGYLSGGTGVRGEDGRMIYKRSKVILHTLFFIIGVSFAFFTLGLGMSVIGGFFQDNRILFARIGGILVILFGLYQLGLFGSPELLGKERRLPFRLDAAAISPVMALVMGFTFSFAWTPCVGPALASVLLMTASAKTQGYGFLLIGVYTLGFVLPFLAVGLFTTSFLEFFKKHGQIVKYTVKIGGALLVLMGAVMLTGRMNGITGYLSQISFSDFWESSSESEPDNSDGTADDSYGNEADGEDADAAYEERIAYEENTDYEENTAYEESTAYEKNGEEITVIPAVDFTLADQYGNMHSLEDYRGKTIFLNFWATWCPPCRGEMPDIQAIYESFDQEGEEALIVLGVVAPELGQETTVEGITAFLEENGYTYPTLMDMDRELFMAYGITSYPTTFMIDRDGNIFGYVTGQLDENIMRSIIQQTMDGVGN